MGSYDEQGWRKGPWTPQEDKLLVQYINYNGEGRWSSVSKCTGLNRSGKSCRLRWVNYLRPGLKKGHLTPQEEAIVIELHALWGNKWSTIARYLPGRTDNEIKNYWRTHFKIKRKPCDQEKSKKQVQRFECDHSNNINININIMNDQFIEATEVKNVAEIEFPKMKNDEESAVSDFIPLDWDLWGGVWNLQDDQNQHNFCYSFEDHGLDFMF